MPSWTPRQPKIDYGPEDTLRDLSALILQMVMKERSSSEAHKRELEILDVQAAHSDKLNQLNILANEHQFQRQRLAVAEEDLVTRGYQLPAADQTEPYREVTEFTLDEYKSDIEGLGDKIVQVNKERANIVAGGLFAEEMEAQFAGATKAAEDEAWKDYMLEGGFQVDPYTGKVAGTGEIAEMMKGLSPEEMGKLKSANYRRAFLQGRRKLKDAKELDKQDKELALVRIQTEGAELAVDKGQMDLANEYYNNAEKIITDSMLEIGKGTLSRLNLEGTGINYLMMLTDPDDHKDVMEKFIESNPEIAEDMRAIMDNFALSKSAGVDWTEAVVRAQAHAYEDFLEARAIEDEVASTGKDITDLPLTTKTRKRYEFLRRRTEQWRKAGMYNGGEVKLRRSYQVIKANEKVHGDRLKADAIEFERISRAGYGINLEDFDPSYYENMDAQKRKDLKIALELLKSMPKAPPLPGQPTPEESFIIPGSAADQLLNLQNWILAIQILGEDTAESLGAPMDVIGEFLHGFGFNIQDPWFGSEHIKEGMIYAPLKAVGLDDIKPLTKEQSLNKAGVASTYLFNVNNE